ncbi:SDR family NAD(P)-dependent oxidoreductase [Streptomyces sp. NPDC057900]|uniref:SDR family NAD(P)-dependent oxidoreductase n=1 Tax=Streptomyces sp. NPDC057900 TaxID=3346274 RepID=UPI0036E105D7
MTPKTGEQLVGDNDIAVVGMACRLPGADTPEEFWQLLRTGNHGITRQEDGTWRAALENHGEFEAEFFGMSPAQAAATDPQQRLVLELGWEALEHAGIVPGRLSGTRTAVYVGVASDDYAALSHAHADATGGYTAAGLHRAMTANRLSYHLGLRGPSMAVDTAQSSSLVAVHLACEGLLRGESDLAVVAGVNLILSGHSTTTMEMMGALSPDGRCHTFDARANGYVRGEGGVCVVLKPLRQALADGDRVHCVVKGGAINNDGGGPSLTTPHRDAQEAVLREAYERAGVRPEDVHYVELHGTGTRAGDPVEAAALGAVLGTARTPGAPLVVGSAKTNVGHLEGAAGIVGFLKTALAVREGELPPSLNYAIPNPDIPLDELNLSLQTDLRTWPTDEADGSRPRRAGVSSFGMGGTNAHLVLEQAPAPRPAEPATRTLPVLPVIVTGRTAEGLRDQAAQLSARIEHGPEHNLLDTAWTQATARTVFGHRAVVLAGDREELLTRLERSAVHGVAGETGRRVLVFPGQGTQWVGMGAGLLESSPVFAARLRECADALAPFVDFDVVEVVRAGGSLDGVGVVQPVTWAVMVSLAELWRSFGVVPDAVVGHSQGEIAAAAVSGALSLEDAARVVALRAGVIGRELAGLGGMASIALPLAQVEVRLAGAGWAGRLSVAAVNGPSSTVVSGDADAITEIVAAYDAEGVRARQVPVDYASHSAHVERIEAELLDVLAPVAPRSSEIPFYSTVTGELVDTTVLDASYWYRNLRQTVRFEETVRLLLDRGFGTFVESSAHPVLGMGVQECADAAGLDVLVSGSLRREEGGWERFLTSAAELFVRGVDIDWSVLFEGTGARVVDLPTYAFQRTRHWIAEDGSAEQGRASGADADETLLSRELRGRSEAEQLDHVLELVRVHAAAVRGRATGDSVAPEKTFKQQGFESVNGIELRNRLRAATGVRLPATLIYDYPTPLAVARLIRDAAAEATTAAPTVPPEAPAGVPARREQPASGQDEDAIAIVGMACRFPGGVGSPEGLWELVSSGVDAVSPFPGDRGWDVESLFDPEPGVAGRSYVREGGFLHGAGGFDAGFFGISPREAVAMDPQQRLLLETSWEALERAGVPADSLKGSRTGVFVGAMTQEYGPRLYENAQGYEGYLLTGNTASVMSGRISYALGLEGPAVTVDTACSSSLVALHLAAQSLRSGECDLALAGGASVMASPGMFVEFSQQRGLASDGRCKAFAEGTDGTGWAEGVGVLLVERLSDAVAAGHRVLAVVRGSAVNQDGASNGLTAPNGPSQQRVIRAALANAGLGTADVDAVEAHGTGTRLGDPIEAQALLATYGRRPVEQPLWLGSLKSNIGHAQAAAGVGGVIKMVMALQEGVLPQTLHVDAPSSQVDWDAGAVELLTESRPWPETGRSRRAGVSAFGVSGTNAHVILEQAPVTEPDDDDTPIRELPVVPLVVSAKSGAALEAQSSRLRARLEADSALRPLDVALSLAAGRSHLEHRSVSFGDLKVEGVAGAPGRRVLVFPGQGTQWVGMGARLLESSPVFAARLRECADALAPFVDFDVVEVVRAGGSLDDVGVVQPVTWAVMVSLAELWRSFGVVPDAVVGHSQGEIAAAAVSGALSLEDAARVVALRAGVIGRELAGLGGMASIPLPLAQVEERLAGAKWAGRLSVAAVNGPSSTVVSGDADAITEIVAAYQGEEVRARQVPVDYASHSAHVERIEAELLDVLAPVTPRSSEIPFYSTVTGELTDTTQLDAAYWYRNLRQTVRFEETVRLLLDRGFGTFVESSAHPVLIMGIQETAEGKDVLTSGSLRREEGGWERFLTSAAELFVRGIDIDWTVLFDGTGARVVDLPTYAFQHEHYWLEPSTQPASAAEASGTDSWRYRTTWKGLSATKGSGTSLSGRWLLVLPEGIADLADEAESALVRNGARTERLILDARTATREALADRLGSYRTEGETFDGVLSLLPLAGGTEAVLASVALLQAAADTDLAPAAVWALTRQAVAVAPGEVPEDSGAQVWALARVAALELPALWGGVVDLPAQPDARAFDRMAAALAQGGRPGAEDQIAVRASGPYGRRVTRAGQAAGTAEDTRWTARGTVLVTGGTGALGAHVARWLAGAGAGHLVLTGRRGPDAPGAAGLAEELRALGAEVTLAACDVSDREALAALLDAHPPTAVFHTAGVLDDGVIGSVTAEAFRRVRAPKADAAYLLHELTRDHGLELDAFVLFSSVTGTWGNGGQAAYAAANASLDVLAEQRRAEGLPATSVAWGLWGGGGMAEGAGEESLSRRGIRAMDPAEGIEALHRALDLRDTCVTVLDVDWADFAPRTAALRPGPVFDTVPEARHALEEARQQASAGASVGPADGLAQRLAALPEAERTRTLVELVRGEAAAVLRHPSTDAIRPDRAFKDTGFDSLTALELRNRIAGATGLRLPATVVFDRPNPGALAAYLLGKLLGDTPATVPAPAPAVRAAGDAEDPIVIVSMACRFPGEADTPEALWDLVMAERDVIGAAPTDRGWNLDEVYEPDPESGRRGTTYVREGGFLHEAAEFDAEFFGISPREALVMDPQQRLLLETSWEALERAGIDPLSLRGTRTGVYVGLTHQEYASRLHEASEEHEGYLLTGKSASVVSGRISYVLGLEGPSVSVDTACSSSLVTLHMAAQAVRAGECDLALAGGVTVMAAPGLFVEFSRQRGLAVDGRSKAFADAADGTSWAEGAGMVAVERMSEAVRRGHRVLAVIRGDAVNQDGASNGLTAPNGPSQERVILQALANAGLGTADVDVVEAHGTGTKLGDPIEAQALLATYGQRPAEQPLWLGSLKSNIGHPQAAAGVGGVIKMVMALQEGVLPRTLHVDAPSSQVDWDAGAVELLTESRPWPETGRPRRAGVSAFGVSGTNAHVILEQAPVTEPDDNTPIRELPVVPLVVSGKSGPALKVQAERLRARLEVEGAPRLLDVGYSLVTSRSVFEHRQVTLGSRLVEDSVGPVGRRVLVFPGQGTQWVGMGAGLLESSPVFAARLRECADALAPFVDFDVVEVVRAGGSLDDVGVVQPVTWAVMVSLAELWRSFGVVPDAVVGHSQGEIAAAAVSGALSLEDAARVVALRAGVIGRELAGLGGMASIPLPLAQVEERLAGAKWAGRLSVAAVNGPSSTVVSGDADAITEIVAAYQGEEVRARQVPVDYASHSAHVERIEAELLDVLAPVAPRSSEIPFYSTVTGELTDTTQLDASYWYRNLRQTVRFEETVRLLLDRGFGTFVESSAHPVLGIGVQECADAAGLDVLVSGSLRREEGGWERFLTSAAELFVRGVDIDWTVLFDGTGAKVVDLPTYAFQRSRHWAPTSPAGVGDAAAARFGMVWETHPLLGGALPVASTGETVFAGRISLTEHPWIADHAVRGRTLLPGTAFVELVLHAAAATGCATVEELSLEAPLVLDGHRAAQVQVRVETPDGQGRRRLTVHSRPENTAGTEEAAWTRHGESLVAPAAPAIPSAAPGWATAWPPAGTERIEPTDVYGQFSDLGYEYGEVFAGIEALWRGDGEVFAEIRLPARAQADATGYGLHPALLDAALQPWLAGGLLDVPDGSVLLPFAWKGITLHAAGADSLRVRITPAGEGAVRLEATDLTAAPVLTLDALVMRPLAQDRLDALLGAAADSGLPLYRVAWQRPAGRTEAGPPAHLAVLGTDGFGIAAAGLAGAGAHTDAAALRAAVDAGAAPPDAVVAQFPADPETTPEDVRALTARGLALVQDWLDQDGPLAEVPLTVLTGQALVATGDDTADGLVAAGLWGLVRSAQTEHPGRFVLVDTDGTPASADALAAALATGETQFALRAGEILVPALTRAATAGTGTEDTGTGTGNTVAAFDPEGTVLVTGATGTLGRLLVRHLVTAHGARRLLLVSRSGRNAAGAAELEGELTTLGARVEIAARDMADRTAVADLLAGIDPAHPLTAVIHAAGVLDDGALTALDAERLNTVLRPKADAALHLHELTRGLPLSAFVLFSGAAGLLGRPGQANYAAANTFLDALAQHRRAAGLPAASLAWGLWGEASGMTGHLSEADLRRMRRSGIAPMTNEQGLALFDLALAGQGDPDGDALLVPLRLDAQALRRERTAHGPEAVPALLRDLVPAPAVPRGAAAAPAAASATTAATGSGSGEGAAEALTRRLAPLGAAARGRELLTLVRTEVAAVLGFAGPEAVEPARAFREIGFDSLTAVELRNRLNAVTGLRLAASLVFDHPTAQAVAAHLGEELDTAASGGREAGEAALAGLEALEAAVTGLAEDDIRREVVHRRLAALVTVMGGHPAGTAAAPEPALELADDELFAFIEEQL